MFAKVFAQIFDSSIAGDYRVRLVFEDFLKLADKDGIVDMTPDSISRRTNVPLDIVVHGITELEKPDRESRSPEHDGRRIIRLADHRTWGWRIVNHSKYRLSATKEMLRMSEADRKKAWRQKKELCPGHNRDKPGRNRDESASASASVSESGKESAERKPEPTHSAFIQGWSESFKAFWKFDYAFEGGRDGKAVKELLRLNILTIDLLELAKSAWAHDGFNCKQASTIHGFKEKLNNIRTELKTIKKAPYRSTITGNY